MTPAELDRLQADIEDENMGNAYSMRVPLSALESLLTLARRGLRAEQECCGRCEHRHEDGSCMCHGTEMRADDFCSRFRAKEGG